MPAAAAAAKSQRRPPPLHARQRAPVAQPTDPAGATPDLVAPASATMRRTAGDEGARVGGGACPELPEKKGKSLAAAFTASHTSHRRPARAAARQEETTTGGGGKGLGAAQSSARGAMRAERHGYEEPIYARGTLIYG